MIGSIGVQSLLEGARSQSQSLLPRRHLNGFEIQIGDRPRT